MGAESPLVTIGVIILIPLLLRNASSLRSKALRPRLWARISQIRCPSEVIVLVTVLALVLYHSYHLLPHSTSARAAKDVFRHVGVPIGLASQTLRNRLNHFSLRDLGLEDLADQADLEASGMEEGDVMERLLRRLGSMAGRQEYLLLGADPLLQCFYCKQFLDFQLFALPPIFLRFAVNLILIGFLTSTSTALQSIDRTIAPTRSVSDQDRTATGPQAIAFQSRPWRGPATTILLTLLLLEVSVVFGIWGWSEKQTSSWNHWHHNSYLLEHAVMATLPLLIYSYPSKSAATISPAVRIAHSLGVITDSVNCSSSNLSFIDAGRSAIWKDEGLRQAVGQWHDERAQRQQSGQDLVEEALRSGLLKPEARQQYTNLLRTRVQAMALPAAAEKAEQWSNT